MGGAPDHPLEDAATAAADPRPALPRPRHRRAPQVRPEVADAPRAVIEHVRPLVDCGAFPAKATVGLPLEVSADVVADGPDLLLVEVRHGVPAGGVLRVVGVEPMEPAEPAGLDRWRGRFTPGRVGPWGFEIVALPDSYGSWARDLRARIEAGQEVAVELETGAELADRQARLPGTRAADRNALQRLASGLRRHEVAPAARLALAERAASRALMRRTADRSRATVAGTFALTVDRELAGCSAWYELFPRSEAPPGERGQGFARAARRLAAIAAMGFDVVYLPPIHPIGRTHRKGPNNALEAAPGDVGSPWAIGSAEGGHTAVHPDLGTLDDFDAFVAAARRSGLEVALDLAFQCSPDHPWVREHPQWFHHRPDGSIRYAENPPKRYQDIYPLDFETDDRAALWQACLDVVRFWMAHGVRIFRVDNPHTKPLRLWDWLIAEVRRTDPGVIFLAEAFTRPRVMQRLAKGGFTQSYTYFTWRNSAHELAAYLTELSTTEMVDWFRPNFWTNTPDILTDYLQSGGRPAFAVRAALAAICAPSWGTYSGYELCENVAAREGSEEYRDSEKYQLRPRDWARPDSLAPLLMRLNLIRRRHRAAIAQLRTLRVHHVDNDAVLCVSRADDARDDLLLLVANLDPHNVREATCYLDLVALGLPGDRPFEAHDELTDTTYTWRGSANYVRLDPGATPAHVLHLRRR